jgi:hypothetical protein
MTTLFGFFALICWGAAGVIVWDARGTMGGQIGSELGVLVLFGLIFTGLWLSYRRL